MKYSIFLLSAWNNLKRILAICVDANRAKPWAETTTGFSQTFKEMQYFKLKINITIIYSNFKTS